MTKLAGYMTVEITRGLRGPFVHFGSPILKENGDVYRATTPTRGTPTPCSDDELEEEAEQKKEAIPSRPITRSFTQSCSGINQ